MTVDEAIEYMAKDLASSYATEEGFNHLDPNWRKASARAKQILLGLRPPRELAVEARELLSRVAKEAALNEPPF